MAEQPELEPWQASLIERHIEFARKGARKYHRLCRGRYPYDELESAAYLGLVKAARKFELSRGLQFTTYAFRWIDSYLRELHQQKRHEQGCMWHPSKAEQEANLAEGRKRWSMRQRISIQGWPQTEDGDDIDLPGGDTVADIWRRMEMRERIRFCYAQLRTPREREIFRGQLRGETFRVTGQRLGISHERVRQIWYPLFDRLRAAAVAAGLAVEDTEEGAA